MAQLVEYDLAKVGVAGSSPVSRSQEYKKGYPKWIPFLVLFKPCRARTFEVSALLRSVQNRHPPDVVHRLALKQKEVRIDIYARVLPNSNVQGQDCVFLVL